MERVREPRPPLTVPASPVDRPPASAVDRPPASAVDRPSASAADRVVEIGPRARPRGRPVFSADPLEWRELALVAATAMVLGFANGAGAVVGAEATSAAVAHALDAAEPPASGNHEADWIRGPLWRPVGSIAVRPETRLRPVLWEPPGSDVRLKGAIAERAAEREVLRD